MYTVVNIRVYLGSKACAQYSISAVAFDLEMLLK